MRLSGPLRFVVLVMWSFLVVGCAGVEYRERSVLVHTRYAIVENFGDAPILADEIDGLLEEVADILNVTLRPGLRKVRILVTSPATISDLYRQVVTVAPHGSHARALYVPGASLVLIPYFERGVLGHELAHYLTDHYLKSTPRSAWERLAYRVEDALVATAPTVARHRPAPDALTTQTAVVPVLAPAN